MLNKIKLTNIFFLIILVLFINPTNSFSKDNFFQCVEKISKVRSGNDYIYREGNEYGTSYIKLSKYQDITIHFKFKKSSKKPIEIIKMKESNSTTLGFDIDQTYNIDNYKSNVYYNFIKINETYAFNKKNSSWNSSEDNYDYDTSSRCTKIQKETYLSLLQINNTQEKKILSYNWSAISKHPKTNKNFTATELSTKEKAINLAMNKCYKYVTKDLNKKGYNNCYLFKTSDSNKSKIYKSKKKKSEKKNDEISGSRTFALSWDGIDELIMGELFFREEDLIGRLSFTIPIDDNKCFGSYVLSTLKGTWSILCEKNNMNASGFLKWNSQNGSVSGSGKDSLGKKVKFKVAGFN
jgi:hypothetical protein